MRQPSAGQDKPWRAVQDGVELRVRLTPKAGHDRIDGIGAREDGELALAARVTAAPEDNKANRALEVLVAKWTGVAKSKVSVSGGAKSRTKTVTVIGNPVALGARLEALIVELE